MTDKNQAKKMGINIIQSQQENNPLFDMLLKNFPQTIKDGQVSLSAIKMLLGFNESMNDIAAMSSLGRVRGLLTLFILNLAKNNSNYKKFLRPKIQPANTPTTPLS
ncbi:hypothetical protein ACR9JU_02110 [Helicobacter pylori]